MYGGGGSGDTSGGGVSPSLLEFWSSRFRLLLRLSLALAGSYRVVYHLVKQGHMGIGSAAGGRSCLSWLVVQVMDDGPRRGAS